MSARGLHAAVLVAGSLIYAKLERNTHISSVSTFHWII